MSDPDRPSDPSVPISPEQDLARRLEALTAILFQPYLLGWSRTQLVARVRATLALAVQAPESGSVLLEDHVTKLLSAVSGPGERSFVRWVSTLR